MALRKSNGPLARVVLVKNPLEEELLKEKLSKIDSETSKVLAMHDRRRKAIQNAMSMKLPQFSPTSPYATKTSNQTTKKTVEKQEVKKGNRFGPEELPQLNVLSLMDYQPGKGIFDGIPAIFVTDCDDAEGARARILSTEDEFLKPIHSTSSPSVSTLLHDRRSEVGLEDESTDYPDSVFTDFPDEDSESLSSAADLSSMSPLNDPRFVKLMVALNGGFCTRK